jgi:hypothetical protein
LDLIPIDSLLAGSADGAGLTGAAGFDPAEPFISPLLPVELKLVLDDSIPIPSIPAIVSLDLASSEPFFAAVVLLESELSFLPFGLSCDVLLISIPAIPAIPSFPPEEESAAAPRPV